MSKLTATLVIQVSYEIEDGANVPKTKAELLDTLRGIPDRLDADGLFSNGLPAETESWTSSVITTDKDSGEGGDGFGR